MASMPEWSHLAALELHDHIALRAEQLLEIRHRPEEQRVAQLIEP